MYVSRVQATPSDSWAGRVGAGWESRKTENAILATGRVGVGGISAPAADATKEEREGTAALDAVRRWLAAPTCGTSFPDKEVLTHYRAVGRLGVNKALVDLLRIAAVKDTAVSGVRGAWLAMTCDQEDGDYDSYIGSGVLTSIVDDAPSDLRPGLVDAALSGAVADLASAEAHAALASGSPEAHVRCRAVARLVTRIPALAPHHGIADELFERHLHDLTADPVAMCVALSTTATALLQNTPSPLCRAVDLSLMPTTRLHDETMFIRCIQIFESIYLHVARHVRAATEAVCSHEADRASEHLDSASDRLEATPVLYRVLTTMPVKSFAVIRDYTRGRSAMQSRPFREVQARCARSCDADSRPTLQDVYLSHRDLLGGEAVRLATAMRRLDRAWRSMKRTHWGLTLKIIGDVSGTGGTSGASYLRASAEMPLFPVLVESGGR